MLNPLRRFVDVIVQVGGWAFLAAACLVTYDVFTRKLLNISMAGADEISGYVFAVVTACAFSYALLSRANIRIDFIYNLLPALAQRLLDILSMAMMAGFLGILSYYAYGLVADAFKYGSHSITPLQTPLAIPQTLWFGALVLSVVTSLCLIVIAIKALIEGNLAHVQKIIGVPSHNDEIKLELSNNPSEEAGNGKA